MLVGFTGNFMINFIAKDFQKTTKYEIYTSDYCQYQQEIIFDNSTLKSYNCDFLVLLLDGEVLIDTLGYGNIINHIDSIVNSFLKQKSAKYLLISNIYIPKKVNSISNYNGDIDYKQIQNDFNNHLKTISTNNQNIFVLDILSLIEENGYKNIADNGTWYYGRNRFTKNGNKLIANQINCTINAINNSTKKCLVLDLDNTLWGGIIGEDGISGIKIAKDGIGEVYKNFQKEILKIKEKGILLAICSKNNLADAKDVFDNHKEMILKWDDFIVHKVNWELKSENIKNIAKKLNIGEDSLVFIDDNPTEREIVSKETNCVVVDFPEREEDLVDLIVDVDLKYFSKMSITNEDKAKHEQYKQNLERQNEEKSFTNIDDFIRNLKITLTIYKDSQEQIARISQLTQKTNQFNLTTKRYSEEDIRFFMNSDDYSVYSAEVSDKYGEYGIVIVSIIEHKTKNFNIDTFLMSCRVIGKKVENVFLNHIFSNYSYDTIIASYIKTAKNELVKEFYDNNGFICFQTENQDKFYKTSEILEVAKNLMEIKNGK